MNIKYIKTKILAITLVAGIFAYSNINNVSAVTDASNAPSNWAFEESSIPLHDAILAKYPTVDTDSNGYISISEAQDWTGTQISLRNNNISGKINGIEHFTNINLIKIDLTYNQFSGTLPIDFGYMDNLKIVQLDYNKFSGAIPDSFENLINLNEFKIGNNLFSGEFPSFIFDLINLEQVSLANNKFNGVIPSEIGNLIKLKSLYIFGNDFSGELPSEIYTLPTLENLEVFNNVNLEGNPSIGFAQSISLLYLDVRSTKLIQAKPNVATLTTFLHDDLASMLLNAEGTDLDIDVTQADIDKAQQSADAWSEPTKGEWQTKIDSAQLMLNAKDATNALLTTDGLDLATDVDQVAITDAEAKVNMLDNGALKDELLAKIEVAQNILNAKEATNNLFTTDGGDLATDVDQAAITDAFDKVELLEDGALKDELNAKIQDAQDILDAKDEVAGIFTDTTKDNILDAITSEILNTIKDKITELVDGSAKDSLNADVILAENILDAKDQIDTIFGGDTDKKTTKPGLSQIDIDNAKEAVDLLEDGPLKDQLLADIINIENIFKNDVNKDGLPDLNIDIDEDGIPDLNVTDVDGNPIINVVTDGNGELKLPVSTTDKPNLNIVTDGNGNLLNPVSNTDTPDLNVDIDGDMKPDLNIDVDNDLKPDLNIVTDGEGALKLPVLTTDKPDVNVVTDGNGNIKNPVLTTDIPDLNVDVDGDLLPDLNVDTDNDLKPDLNVVTDGEGALKLPVLTTDKPDVNVDTDGNGTPDLNVDLDGDLKADINIDTDTDGIPNINIDTDGNDIPDLNIDVDGDLVPDVNIDTDTDGTADMNVIQSTDKNKPNYVEPGTTNPIYNVDTNSDGKPDHNLAYNALNTTEALAILAKIDVLNRKLYTTASLAAMDAKIPAVTDILNANGITSRVVTIEAHADQASLDIAVADLVKAYNALVLLTNDKTNIAQTGVDAPVMGMVLMISSLGSVIVLKRKFN